MKTMRGVALGLCTIGFIHAVAAASLGVAVEDPLRLEVNTITGELFAVTGDSPVEFIGYSITTVSGDPGPFDPHEWEQTNLDARDYDGGNWSNLSSPESLTDLTEARLDGDASLLESNSRLSLGIGFDTEAEEGDIKFEYIVGSGEVFEGAVLCAVPEPATIVLIAAMVFPLFASRSHRFA